MGFDEEELERDIWFQESEYGVIGAYGITNDSLGFGDEDDDED